MSDNIVIHTALSQTQQHFRHLGLTLPKPFTAALEQAEQDISPSKMQYDPSALAQAVADCLTADKDPALDKKVQVELVREQLHRVNIADALAARIAASRAVALTTHTPAVVEVMRPAVEQADEHLAALHDVAPSLDLTDVSAASRLKPAQLSLWGYAREAVAALQRIEQVWIQLAQASGRAQVMPEFRPLILADLDATALQRLGRKPDTAAVAHTGHRLSLASFDTYAERVARVLEQRREQDQRAEAERMPARQSLLPQTAA